MYTGSSSKPVKSSLYVKHQKESSDKLTKYMNLDATIKELLGTSNKIEQSLEQYDDNLSSSKQASDTDYDYDDIEENACTFLMNNLNQQDEMTEDNFKNENIDIAEDKHCKVKNNKASSDKLFFIPNVTPELIATQKLLLASMIYSYQKVFSHYDEINDEGIAGNAYQFLNSKIPHVMTKISEITKELFIETPEKDEIFPNSTCYMDKSLLLAIKLSNDGNDSWSKFTTDILVQIYGEYLKFMSLKDTRGNIAINKKLLKAIYCKINSKRTELIISKTFNSHINKICSNRKRLFGFINNTKQETASPPENIVELKTKATYNNEKINVNDIHGDGNDDSNGYGDIYTRETKPIQEQAKEINHLIKTSESQPVSSNINQQQHSLTSHEYEHYQKLIQHENQLQANYYGRMQPNQQNYYRHDQYYQQYQNSYPLHEQYNDKLIVENNDVTSFTRL